MLHDIKRRGLPTLSFRPDNLFILHNNDKTFSLHFDLLLITAKEIQYLYGR